MARTRVALVYGGRSGEHEVSVESASSVVEAIDSARYDLLMVKIDHDGAWIWSNPSPDASNPSGAARRVLPSADPSKPGLMTIADSVGDSVFQPIDVAFPVVHGTYGEDGCIQGLLELAGIPYVGSGVLASAVSMDKILMKSVFRAHGFPVVESVAVDRADWEADPGILTVVQERIGFPCFVKPANLGSSVGIQKVRDAGRLAEAVANAAEFSARLIVEQGRDVREIECGVLGNHDAAASVVGEVIPTREFYDYDAKYHDPSTAFVIPADLPEDVSERVRGLAIEAFKAIGGAGMARVDFFLDRNDGSIYLNEINTIPGFTSMSVYPRLWAASGVPYSELVDRLIALAVDRYQDQGRNRTRYA